MECAACKRGFIICASNVRGEPRTYEDVAYIAPLPVEFVAKCDFCLHSGKGLGAINAGLQQRTCAACHTECLSSVGL